MTFCMLLAAELRHFFVRLVNAPQSERFIFQFIERTYPSMRVSRSGSHDGMNLCGAIAGGAMFLCGQRAGDCSHMFVWRRAFIHSTKSRLFTSRSHVALERRLCLITSSTEHSVACDSVGGGWGVLMCVHVRTNVQQQE